jgi:RND family efflux transporter MFP subunit
VLAILLLVAGVAGVVALAARGGVAERLPFGEKAKPKPLPVPLQFSPAELTRPVLQAMPRRIEFSGPLVAPNTAIVRTKSPGTLLALSVAEGQRVRAGQSLGRLDLADLESRLDDRGASVQQAEAQLAEAERLHASNQGLARQNFISEVALQSSQARLDAARAQLRSARAQLSSTRIGVRDAALVAPIAGIVGKRHVVPGEKLAAEQPVFTVVDLARLELAGTVATHEVSLLAPGQPVQVTVEGWPEPVTGRIDRIAPSAEAGTRAIGVVVALANPGERLRAGQYAQALVTQDDATPRLTLPLTALSQASGQDQVWTLEGGVLVRRIVITGRRDAASGRVEVLSGLPADALVLAARFDNLKEGAPAVQGTGTSAAAAAASAVASVASAPPSVSVPASQPAPAASAAPVTPVTR